MRNHFTSPSILVVCLCTFFGVGALIGQQGVGIGTTSPAVSAILDIASTDRGILIPRMTTMVRENIVPTDEGLMVYDTTRRMLYVASWDDDEGMVVWKPLDAFWSENSHGIYYESSLGIGTQSGNNEKLKVSASGQQIGIEVQNIASDAFLFPRYGIFATAGNWNNHHLKSGGRFTALGTGLKIGASGIASGDSINIGIHGTASGDLAINRAAWFESGDVAIDNRVLIGSNDILDVPEESALLELRSTTRGLLLSRMSAVQRMAIGSPEQGLVVYDTDSSAVFFRNAMGWQKLGSGGGGGGSGHWVPDGQGIHYNTGNVGIGPSAGSGIRLSVDQGNQAVGIFHFSSAPDAVDKTGIWSTMISGTGAKTAIAGQAHASTENNASIYGVKGETFQSSSAAHVYGIYGAAYGSGNGQRWAGYFGEGNVKVDNQMLIGDFGLPYESALLELKSTSKAFLLPRMTAGQRNSISPLTFGLMVFDTDSNDVFVYKSGWKALGGEGTGSNLWSNVNGLGIYYNSGNVGIGNFPALNTQLNMSTEHSKGIYIFSSSTDASKYGIDIQLNNDGAGEKYGVKSQVIANNNGTQPVYGIHSSVFGAPPSEPVYAVYGKIEGAGGAGERWAGYFAGNAKVEQQLYVDNKIHVGNGVILHANFAGTGRVTTQVLEITGGSDLAEYFRPSSSAEELSPGTVVSIDPHSNGTITRSRNAYDRHVVGVVSGANGVHSGMLMGQQGSVADGDVPVAMVGRVYVQVDESHGRINPGDFLTSSATPGYAMRVKNTRKAQGSILGKALSAADENGFALVLVHLQ